MGSFDGEEAPVNDQRKAWEEVGESLNQVGRRLKEQFEKEGLGKDAAPEGKKVEDALKTLADAVGQAFDAVGAAVSDEGFRKDVTKAARSFGEAMAQTFDQVGDELRERMSNRKARDGEQKPPDSPNGSST